MARWLARALGTVFTYPLFRLRNMATKSARPLSAVAADVWQDGGVRGFFSGCAPEVIRGATLQAFLNLVKEHLTNFNTVALTRLLIR